MNKINPKWIGLFVIIGMVAIAGLLMVFGGGAFGGKPQRYVLFFDQSVNGLNPGATVKFRGVPVGSVERITLRIEGQSAESRAIPVVITLKPRRLERDLGLGADLVSKENMRSAIERGLAARLNLESFVTGLLFVELDFINIPGQTLFHLSDTQNEWLEIPTVPSPFDQLTSDIVTLIGKADDIDFAALIENVKVLVDKAGSGLDALDLAGMSESSIRLMDNFSDLVESGSIEASLLEVSAAAKAFAEVSAAVEALVSKIDSDGLPLGPSLEATLADARELLAAWKAVAEDGSRLLSGESEFRDDLNAAMQNWSDSARSLRSLLEILRDNPRSILSGRNLQGFEGERD